MVGSLWLEVKYLNLISHRLPGFKKKEEYLYTCRCPICGDSKASRFKARGYIYQVAGKLRFMCHNCRDSRTISSFIKEIDPETYREYRLELLKENGRSIPAHRNAPVVTIHDKPLVSNNDPLKSLKRITQFSKDHPVSKYVAARRIPPAFVDRLYYATRFMEWINLVSPGKFDDRQLKMDEPRLVIPFIDTDGKVFAATGRSFKKNSIKYLTVKFDDQAKVYGLDRIDPSKRVYIVEGPIDSFFIDNSIAFAGSSGTIPEFDDSVIVLDNEPRNAEIVRLNEKFISQGRKVCIWPSSISQKDLNELVIDGYTQDQIKSLIDTNTSYGLAARMKLNDWKVVG